jgi:hypothetical protein
VGSMHMYPARPVAISRDMVETGMAVLKSHEVRGCRPPYRWRKLRNIRYLNSLGVPERVRPVFNRRRIIVLTNIALDLTVDHALTWLELRPGKFAHAFAQHGVLPLSAGDLCRGFPSLWPSENTAKSDLSRSGLIGCNPPIIITIGSLHPISGDTPQRPVWSTYQSRN